MSISRARADRISGNPKEFHLEELLDQNENEIKYPPWTSGGQLLDFLVSVPESTMWHAVLCVLSLLAIVILSMDFQSSDYIFGLPTSELVDILYNALYGLHAAAHMIKDCYWWHHEQYENSKQYWMWYTLDLATYLHYAVTMIPETPGIDIYYIVKMICYYVRLRRPLKYLWYLNSYYLKNNIIGTFLKFWYIIVLLRVIYTNAFIWMGMQTKTIEYIDVPEWLRKNRALLFFRTFYMTNKRFIPIGIDWPPDSTVGLLATAFVMVSGALVTSVGGATLALIISLHMRPAEVFRQRLRLICNQMKETHVPSALRRKVETFYKMYWDKQKGVSITKLLPTFPPTLANTLNTDIYFEAFQKSHILCDLSYQFLSEVAKHMKTITYIPGEFIIERQFSKQAIIYIDYGDVELVTPEDDETPMLRFVRGTILNPCGGCVEVASSTSHISVRAATFCVVYVLMASDLWRVSAVHGRGGNSYYILASFHEHFQKVFNHYQNRPHHAHAKSSVLILKHNLLGLKEAKDDKGKPLMDRTDAFVKIAGCYTMRNQPDASLIDESDEICLKPTFPCILQPSSSLQTVWNLCVTAIALVVTGVHPYCIIFLRDVSPQFIFFDFIVTIVFFLDVVVVLSTGIKVEEGIPLNLLETASYRMRSFWFVLDVLSVVPVMLLVLDGKFAGMNKLFKLPKAFRTLKQMEDEDIGGSLYNVLRFITFGVVLIVLCWLEAALNHSILCFKFRFCHVVQFAEEPYWNRRPLNNSTFFDTMLFSLYSAVSLSTLTSHLSEAISKHKWEMQAVIMIMLEICLILQVIVLATYSATIMVSETMLDKHNECVDTVKLFLERNYVDPVICDRFVNYLQLCWFTDKAYGITHQKSSLLFDLPRHIFQDIYAMQRNKYLLCIPFMKALPPSMLKSIAAQAHLFHTSPNEILLNTGDMSNEIYVIKQGFCEVFDPITKKVVNIISIGSHFSDIECLMRIPVYYTVRAVTHVQIFSVSRKLLSKALKAPQIKDLIAFIKTLPEYQQLVKTSRHQFLKYEQPPPPPNREVFPLLRKHEPDIAFLYPFQRLGFFAVFKYIFPRFTIRPDGTYLRRYELFRAFCAFFSALTPSIYLMMLQFPWVYYASYVLDYFAYFDIVQRMLVGYYDERGILVYHPAITAAHYMRGAFILDLLACLPLENLDSIQLATLDAYFRHEGYTIITRLTQGLMLNRCLQMYRLPNALNFLHKYIRRRDIVLLIKFIPIYLAFVNAVGTLIIIFAMAIRHPFKGGWQLIPYENQLTKSQRGQTWIVLGQKHLGYNMTETPFNLWLTAYYFATYQLTNTGYCIFKPNRWKQIAILLVAMTACMIMLMYLSVRVLSIRSTVNQALADFQENMKDMITFMKRERFHKDLQREVLAYYEYTWEKTGGTDYRSVFKLCDQITLRTDAILHIYGKTFHKCPVLYQCDMSLLRLLGRAVHSEYFCPGTTVIERDDVIDQLYFIDYGTLEARDAEDDDHVDTKLMRGSIFGNLNNVERVVSPNRFVVNSHAHLLKIEAILFYKILEDFPNISKRLKQCRPENETYIIGRQLSHTSVQSTWSQRAATSVIMVAKKTGVLKYLHAHGKLMQIYLIIICTLCVIFDVYNASFRSNGKHLIRILYVLDVAFLPKVVLNILSPYMSQAIGSGRHLKESRKMYFLGEFKYDVLSLIPFELFCLCFHDKWKVFPLLRLNRFFRVVTIYTSLNIYKKLTICLHYASIAAVSIWFTIFIHTTTCLWHALGSFEDSCRPKTSWRWDYEKNYLCFKNEYICSLYFILTTFTGNGAIDILPRRQTEVAFVIVLMILSKMMYMMYAGEFCNIIRYQFNRCFTFYSQYLELNAFLKTNRVARNLVDLTKKYTLHLWREARGLQEPYFLTTAPRCLRFKIMAAAYMKHLQLIPAFKHCEPIFLRQLVTHLQPFYYDEDMFVVREGEITNAMYFVHKGRVQELMEDEETKMFTPKTYFGTIQGLFRDNPYIYSYKTKIKSIVLTLSLDKWEYLLEHFPNNIDIISKYHTGPGEKSFKQSPRKRSSVSVFRNQSRVDVEVPTKVEKVMGFTPTKKPADKVLAEEKKHLVKDMPPGMISDSVRKTEPVLTTQPTGHDDIPLQDIQQPTSVMTSKDVHKTELGSKTHLTGHEEIPLQDIEQLSSPIVVDLNKPVSIKSSEEIELNKISLTGASDNINSPAKSSDEVQSLLAPPGERDHDSFTSLHAGSHHLDPSQAKIATPAANKTKDKPEKKRLQMISKPEEFEIANRSVEDKNKSTRVKATASLTVKDSEQHKLKIGSMDETVKKVRISTKEDQITQESQVSIIKGIQQAEDEANMIATVLSSMSLHSMGDVEDFMAEETRRSRQKGKKGRQGKKE